MRELKNDEIGVVIGASSAVPQAKSPVIPVLPGHGKFPPPGPIRTPVPVDSNS